MIPAKLLSYERSARFWTDLVSVTDAALQRDGEDFRSRYGLMSEPTRIAWPLPAGFAICLELNAALDAELLLDTPQGGSFTLGWDDQAHWHPHVLRREELERICRCIALTNPSDTGASHPRWPIRLLDRFAPVCDADDANAAYATLFATHRQHSGLDDETIQQIVQHSDCRGSGFSWKQTQEYGWVIDQTDENANRRLYSIRTQPVPLSAAQEEIRNQMRDRGLLGPEYKFPFHQWNTCMAAIDRSLQQLRVIGDHNDDAKMFAESPDDESLGLFTQTIQTVGMEEIASMARDDAAVASWIVEHAIGCDIGMITQSCTDDFSILTVRSLSVHYGIPDKPKESESPLFSKLFVVGLNAMLRDLQVGSADHMSSGSKPNSEGKEISTGQSDAIRTVLAENQLVDMVRTWFVYGGGPLLGANDKPRPTLTRQLFSDPLDDDLHDAPTGKFTFNLIRLQTTESQLGFNLRRVAVEDCIRRTIAGVLEMAGYRVNFRNEENDGDGLTLQIDQIDSASSERLWEVMHQHELILLPHLIAPSASVANQVKRHTDLVTICKASNELAKILCPNDIGNRKFDRTE